MAVLDWIVVLAYFLVIIVLAYWFGRTQHSVHDYYLAGRKIRWWQSGLSTMATQLGAISFVSAPAFVAIKPDGGLKWLCYEFGVPIGVLVAMVVIVPRLHDGGYVSAYAFLEERFDRGTRTLVSILFQLGRGLATAVSVLAGGLILSTATPLSTAEAILVIGVVTMIYDVMGGMRVVIMSDVLQMAIIVIGILICGGVALHMVGWSAGWAALGPERARVLDFSGLGIGGKGEYGFWPMTIGGIFLYASYYGCDQSQVQRELSVGSVRDVRRSLLVNAFGRFPVVLLYCLMGVMIGAVFAAPDRVADVAGALGMNPASVTSTLQANPDRMVPMFVLAFLPVGVVGLVIAAILSALMSSLDSAINSLSAVTMQDVYRAYVRPAASDRHYLIVSKLFTAFWGTFCILAALVFAGSGQAVRETTIVLINSVGSLLYGPILAAFLLGITTLATARQTRAGVVAGIAVNVLIWQLTDVSWLWWNVTGFFAAMGFAALWHRMETMASGEPTAFVRGDVPRFIHNHRGLILSLLAYSVGIIILARALEFLG